jgi:chromosome segregation ATPase
LLIRNFKRVTLAEVEVRENGLTIIGGANAQGKSTFLDAVKFLLGGAKHEPTDPHNRNAGGATAVLRTRLSNGIEVERSGDGCTLKVKVDGKKGNQATLTEFLNEFALDVSKFMRATDKDKAKMLITHLGIGEALEQLDAKIKALFDERTVQNRDADRKRKLADAMPTYDNAPESRVDVTELMAKYRALDAENRTLDEKTTRVNVITNDGRSLAAERDEYQRRIDAINAKLDSLRSERSALLADIDAMERHDLAPIEAHMKNSESLNMMVEANAKGAQAEQEAREAAKVAQDLTDSIEEARQQQRKMIDDIPMPLDGLKIEDGELMYRGQRWDCMSGSERLKVATAISRAFKPECGFVLVDELEQMDWSTITEFDAWAKEQGVQILGAMVCDEDKAGENVIIIEDGRVKG